MDAFSATLSGPVAPATSSLDPPAVASLKVSGGGKQAVSSPPSPRIYVYGQAPARGQTDLDAPAFGSGRNGLLFEKLTGVPLSVLHERWMFRNVLRYWPGRERSGGDRFPRAEARSAAAVEMTEWRSGDSIIFCGRLVAEAFDFDAPWFVWEPFGRVRAAVMPHPSGLVRFWNDVDNRERARAFLSELERSSR